MPALKQQPKVKNPKILVVGDLMLDEYVVGHTSRVSPEAPVPIVHFEKRNYRLGGAGNVANNLYSLGANVTLHAIVGDDKRALTIKKLLNEKKIKHNLVIDKISHTVTKTRILGNKHQLLRIDCENGFSDKSQNEVLINFKNDIKKYDFVLFSDYAKGTLKYVPELIEICNSLGKTCIVDPKNKDFSIYKNANLVKPNLAEFEVVVGKSDSKEEIYRKGFALMRRHNFQSLLITMSEKGMIFLQSDGTARTYQSQVKEISDVTGAGDTVLATLAFSMVSGISLATSVQLSNAAASIVVKKIGTSSISQEEYSSLNVPQDQESEEESYSLILDNLISYVKKCRSNKKKIVFTNGCFDILHPGHIRYLRQAKKLGDILIVGINSDNSVRNLKGQDRPINKLADRSELLLALNSVDYVVPFNEDTPSSLIEIIKPDFLAKGSDYKESEIAGADFVKKNKGKVKLLDFHNNYSTTKIIANLQE